MTKIFKNNAAQGDCFLVRVDKLPDGLVDAGSENGRYIVAHSETGHHHTINFKPDNVRMYEDPNDPLVAYLQVIGNDVKLEHQRSFDTHETIQFTPGIFRVTRQREYTAEGFRRAQD